MTLAERVMGWLGAGATPRASAYSGAPASGYAGASQNRRMRNLRVSDAGPNAALAADGDELRRRSRHFVRNNAYAASAMDVYSTSLVGEGMTPRSMHPDETRAAELDALWKAWQAECDALGQNEFSGLLDMVARSEFEGGEAFVRLRRRRDSDGLAVPLQLQVVEPEMVPFRADMAAATGRGRVVAGVELNGVGAPVAYHMHKEHPRDSLWLSASFADVELRRVPKRAVLHVLQPSRAGALRGTPMLAPVLERLWLLHQMDNSEQEKQALAANIQGFFENDLAAEDAPGPGVDGGDPQVDADGMADIVIGPGLFANLPAGVKPHQMKTEYPDDGYAKFHDLHGHLIAAALGLPFELLTRDLRQVNYSSARVGLVHFYRRMRKTARRYEWQLCNPVWAAFVDAAFDAGVLRDARWPANRADYLQVVWRPDGWEWVDPLKESTALLNLWQAGMISREQGLDALGYDPQETERLVREERERGVEPREAKTAPPPADDDSGDRPGTGRGARALKGVTAVDGRVM